MFSKKDIMAVNTIRTLSISQIESANSGHPGLPMGASPMAYVLWNKILNVNPECSKWHNRDRFILSAGHGSAMLYSLLHLSGFDVSIDDLKNFREIGSKTPGHPERNHTDGVEVTTGPLGQGIANAVGFAIAEKHLAKIYNRKDLEIVDHYTYALCGDGDLMEGISYESMSLAGHLNLNKLIILHDSNDICLDGNLSTSFSENIEARVKSQNWNYIRVSDGNDLDAIYEAINKAKESKDKPSFIEIKTVIGYGSKNQATNKVHGAPIGREDFEFAKKAYKWDYDDFDIPEEVYQVFRDNILKNGKRKYQEWLDKFNKYKQKYPEDAKDYMAGFERKLDENWIDHIKKYTHEDKSVATRASSGAIIQDIAKINKNFWGGSADLFSSNKTDIKNSERFSDENPQGRNLWYGVREFAMSAIANAIVAHGGSFHHISTFFVFSDYLKAGLRLSALSQIPVTYVFTHDSVAVGEDGPTHQPIEQLAMIRSIPNTIMLRPCDANEVRLSWKIALESKKTPVVIALTRQNVKNLEETEKLDDISKGAYIIKESNKDRPDGIIIATGSEVELALEVREELLKDTIDVRVVSMPSFELFRKQNQAYKEKILPRDIKNRLSIEMATTFGWSEFTGDDGVNIGIDRFGISGNFKDVKEELGFGKVSIAKKYKEKFNK